MSGSVTGVARFILPALVFSATLPALADCGWSPWVAADPVKAPALEIRKLCKPTAKAAALQFRNMGSPPLRIVWQGVQGAPQTASLGPGVFVGPMIVRAEQWVGQCDCGVEGWFIVNILSAT